MEKVLAYLLDVFKNGSKESSILELVFSHQIVGANVKHASQCETSIGKKGQWSLYSVVPKCKSGDSVPWTQLGEWHCIELSSHKDWGSPWGNNSISHAHKLVNNIQAGDTAGVCTVAIVVVIIVFQLALVSLWGKV